MESSLAACERPTKPFVPRFPEPGGRYWMSSTESGRRRKISCLNCVQRYYILLNRVYAEKLTSSRQTNSRIVFSYNSDWCSESHLTWRIAWQQELPYAQRRDTEWNNRCSQRPWAEQYYFLRRHTFQHIANGPLSSIPQSNPIHAWRPTFTYTTVLSASFR